MNIKTFITAITLMMSMMSFANGESNFIGEQLELEVGYYDESQANHPKPRTPETIPTIYFDGTTLNFATPCDGYTLQIVDAAENICYELVIPIGTQQITLPDYLVGEYELRITNSHLYYYSVLLFL